LIYACYFRKCSNVLHGGGAWMSLVNPKAYYSWNIEKPWI